MYDITLEGLQDLAKKTGMEIVGDVVDERVGSDGIREPGQWCVTCRKLTNKE